MYRFVSLQVCVTSACFKILAQQDEVWRSEGDGKGIATNSLTFKLR